MRRSNFCNLPKGPNKNFVHRTKPQLSPSSILLQNLVEGETNIFELMLQHNEIETLDGALMGIHGLNRLNLSHNRLKEIAPDDFIGLDSLKLLDISHNLLSTLEETSKVR